MTEFRTIPIGSLGRIITGKTPPSVRPELFGDLHPFLTPTDIDGFARYIEPTRFLSHEGYGYQHQFILPEQAVCVVCIGATIGKVCMTGRLSFTNQQINSVVVNEDEHDPFFVYYLLTTLRDELRLHAGGAATPIINKTTFSEIKISVPSLQMQRQIASIISAYDDLIENSQRRIWILEAMARALYREWFVHFRFPGYERTLEAGTLIKGIIPKGWVTGNLGDICQVIPGYAFKSDEWQHSGVPVIKIKNIQSDNTIDTEATDHVSEDVFQHTQKKFVLRQGDILIAMTGATAGKIGKLRTEQTMLLNQRVAKLDPVSPYQEFVWCSISTDEAKHGFFLLADGAAQPNMSGAQIEGVKLLYPTKDLAEKFSKMVGPILQQTDTLYLKIQKLRRTRDLLLPRLLSGQILLGGSRE